MATELVPFGKYKGQPVEVLRADQGYCEWLMAQDWFRAQYGGIHTLIVNHFGEPRETPEHNALQARFLDENWCQRFAIAAHFLSHAERRVREMVKWLDGEIARKHSYGGDYYSKDIATHEQAKEWLRQSRWFFEASAEFEVTGVDVMLTVTLTPIMPKAVTAADYVVEKTYAIECKPIVADDYPAILRQMKANNSHYLVAGDVHSQAVTEDAIRTIFINSGIQVLTVAAIEAQTLLWDEPPF